MVLTKRNLIMSLKNKHILLGITGGIAAYKCAHLVRLLIKEEITFPTQSNQLENDYVLMKKSTADKNVGQYLK